MVLAVSVLVVTVLSMLAQISLRRGLQAADAQRDLQRRWGRVTLQAALLKEAAGDLPGARGLAAESTPGVPPSPTIRAAITLGGVTFDLLLGDEDAKLNLNTIYHHSRKREDRAGIGEHRTETVAVRAVGSSRKTDAAFSRESS